jgi:hypothetical protein
MALQAHGVLSNPRLRRLRAEFDDRVGIRRVMLVFTAGAVTGLASMALKIGA